MPTNPLISSYPNQQEILENIELLDTNGCLIQPGWARQPYWHYQRNKIHAPWHRIKEWDYYAILSQKNGYGLTVTVSDLSYIAFIAVCWLDFHTGLYRQQDVMLPLTRGKLKLPENSQKNVTFKQKGIEISFLVDNANQTRRIIIHSPQFIGPNKEKGLNADILLSQQKSKDSMNIATSWKENPRAFYYNQKINCMPAIGQVILGNEKYSFQPETEFACLDWGRGNWTYQNRWFWSSASGLWQGNLFGWNIGYGFSDRSIASENVLFFNGKIHKLDQVTFMIDDKDYMKPWRFVSNDHRFTMDFQPIVDRKSAINLGIIKTDQHQVFGYFNGQAVLDDGQTIEVNNFLGFAEDVFNRL